MTTARRSSTARTLDSAATAAEQLTLLPPTEAPLQFRLDDRTRRRGLANVALIRQQLAEQAARREATEVSRRPAPARTPMRRLPAA